MNHFSKEKSGPGLVEQKIRNIVYSYSNSSSDGRCELESQ